MRQVVRFTIKQTVLINVVFVIMVIAGVFSVLRIPLENMPTVDMGRIFIFTQYYGAPAEDVEQLVTTKIEDSIDGLESVEYIQSRSFRNFSTVEVKLIDDADYKDLYDEIRFRTLNIKDELPSGADEPTFFYINTHIWKPVIVANITGDVPQTTLKLLADDLKNRFKTIPDLRSIVIEGEFVKEFHVSIDPEKLRRYGITFHEAASAIESANTKIPTGRFRQDTSEYMLDAGDRLSSQEDVLDVIVRNDGDHTFIRVRDLVTSARVSYRDPINIYSVNGEDTLRLWVIKEEAGDSVEISEQVKVIAGEFAADHEQDGIKVVLANDSTIEINESVKTLGGNLILGMILVTLLLWFTMGFRNAMLTAIGIPFSFLSTIVIMNIYGVSLNTISLFSFVLVTGIIVDDAIIIMENIFRHIEMGKSKKEAIIDGTSEVMVSVISAALTTMLAFIPMLIMTGSTGDFFEVIPKTVTFALIASLVEALIILPIHVLDWGPEPVRKDVVTEDEDPFCHLRSGIFAPAWNIYRAAVTRLLNHKLITVTSVFFLFFACLVIFVLSATGIVPLINVQFFPGNYYRYHVTIAMPVGTSIEKTDAVVRDISGLIMSMGEKQAQSALGITGYYEDKDYIRHSGNNYGQVVVTLPEKANREFPENSKGDPMLHLDYIRTRLTEYIAGAYNEDLSPFVTVFEENEGPPTGKPVNIRVTGLTLEGAIHAADRIKEYMGKDKEMKDLTDMEDDRPYLLKTLKFIPKQEKVFEYGLKPGQVTAIVASLLNGYHAGDFRTFDKEVDLKVRLSRKDDPANHSAAGLEDPLDVLDVPVVEHSASPVYLRDLVDVRYVQEPNKRLRYKGKPAVTITADIKGGSKLSPQRIQYLVKEFFRQSRDVFPDVTISFGGEFETTSKSFESLTFAFFIALMLIYMVLSSQFNDYLEPFMILSAVPFALIGVIIGLFVTRTTFTVVSFMAIVGLVGVSVNDSLILIDFMNVRLKKRRELRAAIIEACAARMRPVIITTVTTVLGLLPMALGFPNKSIAWSPMAMTFVTGMVSSTILTLLILPVEFEIVEKFEAFVKRKRKTGIQETLENVENKV